MNNTTELARKHASIRRKNTKLIINLLRNRPDSTFNVGKTLNLSSGGAKKLVDDIASGGIIAKVQAAPARAGQGRPPIEYGVNPSYCSVAIVDYAAQRASLLDFGGAELDSFAFDYGSGISDDDVVDLADRVEGMLARHKGDYPVAAIAISYLGRVDSRTHGKILSGAFRDCNVNIYEYYKERFGTEIILRNDLQFAILAERRSGAITGDELSCCYLQIGSGVASAMLIGDKLYLGAHGIAGEIGQNTLLRSTDAARIENYLDCGGLKRALRARAVSGEKTELSGNFGFSEILAAYRAGDELTKKTVAEWAREAGLLIKNMIEFMDFDAIILSGGMTEFGDEYTDEIRRTVQGYGYDTRIVTSGLKGNAAALGAFEAARDAIIDKFSEERTAHSPERATIEENA